MQRQRLPETATLILLTTNPYALLPTIRSRCVQFFFSALQTEWVEQILGDHKQMAPAERKLAAQLAEGSPGEAVSLVLAALCPGKWREIAAYRQPVRI